jgi:hypothetical protein
MIRNVLKRALHLPYLSSELLTILFGGFVIGKHGKPLIRYRYDGSAFYVKEPGVVKEILLFFFGGTTSRDKGGIPHTDAYGKNIRYPRRLNKKTVKPFSIDKTKNTANISSEK